MSELVGILNLTPDSFSGDGFVGALPSALARIDQMMKDGAQVIDIGAESTRPGAEAISWQQEWQRLEPIANMLGTRTDKVRFSIDTRHAETAERALAKGFSWVNDVSGGDDAMLQVISKSDCTYVLTHSLGVPADPARALDADTDAVKAVRQWAEHAIRKLEKQNIQRSRIVIDPGIGFGKSAQQSLELVKRIAKLQALGVRVLVGHSRKSFLSLLTNNNAAMRDAATLAVSDYLITQKVDYLRVHDVESHAVLLRTKGAL